MYMCVYIYIYTHIHIHTCTYMLLFVEHAYLYYVCVRGNAIADPVYKARGPHASRACEVLPALSFGWAWCSLQLP